MIAEACRPPSDVAIPVTQWSASLLGCHVRAQGFALSDRSVSRILKDADLQPHRQKMWLISHDDEFRQKRDDVLRVYYDTPSNEHIICLDEKTGMQALERKRPDSAMRPGQPIRREFEYIRHGTLCLMGARWTLHFTPKHASWLNQIECAFSFIGRHVLGRGSFVSLEELRQRVHDYLIWFNQQDALAFRWSYRPKSWGMSA